MIVLMMMNTSARTEGEVFDEPSKMEDILEARMVYGVYDIIVKADVEETKDKKKADINGRIRQLKKCNRQ